ncbi:MAG: phosphoribosylglycinamide formyltransferase [Candidatus Dormibacteria bacterium]
MTRLGVLVSGRGTNLQAILEACREDRVNAEVAVVASNKSCPALDIARAARVPVVRVFSLADHGGTLTARDAAMADVLDANGVDLVVTAGYDRINDEAFVARFPGRIVNVHPSLLPAFAGSMHAIRQAFEAGVTQTGVTIHLIEPNTVDSGRVLAQATVPVKPGDTLEQLEERVHAAEHQLLPATIQALIEGRLPSALVTGQRRA